MFKPNICSGFIRGMAMGLLGLVRGELDAVEVTGWFIVEVSRVLIFLCISMLWRIKKRQWGDWI